MVIPLAIIGKLLSLELVLIAIVFGLYVIINQPGAVHCKTRFKCYLKTNGVIVGIMVLIYCFQRLRLDQQTYLMMLGAALLMAVGRRDDTSVALFSSIFTILSEFWMRDWLWTGHGFLLLILLSIYCIERERAACSGTSDMCWISEGGEIRDLNWKVRKNMQSST